MSGVNIPTKKPINRRSKTKEAATSDKNVRNEVEVNSQLQKLGTLKGLPIMRAAGTEPNNPVVAKASKNALSDLSSQLEKRKSKEAMIADLKAAKKGITTDPVQRKAKLATDGTVQSVQVKNRSESPNPNKPQLQPLKNKSDDETMKALLKSSLPKNMTKLNPPGAVVSVTASLGGSASLPCSLSSSHAGDRPRLVLWFREEEPARPIYTVDLRGKYS